jgi:hypothetical protein
MRNCSTGPVSTKSKAARTKAGRVEAVLRSRDQRVADGKALRDSVSRASHGGWKRQAKRRDPIDILWKRRSEPQAAEARNGILRRAHGSVACESVNPGVLAEAAAHF